MTAATTALRDFGKSSATTAAVISTAAEATTIVFTGELDMTT